MIAAVHVRVQKTAQLIKGLIIIIIIFSFQHLYASGSQLIPYYNNESVGIKLYSMEANSTD